VSEDQRFGPGAQRLSGLAMRALGWRPDDFWRATPAELAAALLADADQTATPPSRDEIAALMELDHD
jgi:hypothetical protein